MQILLQNYSDAQFDVTAWNRDDRKQYSARYIKNISTSTRRYIHQIFLGFAQLITNCSSMARPITQFKNGDASLVLEGLVAYSIPSAPVIKQRKPFINTSSHPSTNHAGTIHSNYSIYHNAWINIPRNCACKPRALMRVSLWYNN